MRSITLLSVFFAIGMPYKILVYNSKMAHSHSKFLGRITDILVDAGHDVTSLMPIFDSDTKDGTEKSRKIYVEQDADVAAFQAIRKKKMLSDAFVVNIHNPMHVFVVSKMFTMLAKQCKRTLQEEKLLETLKKEKFDVMIVEYFDMCGLGLSHIIKPKALIGSISTAIFSGHQHLIGIPTALSYNPTSLTSHLDVHSIVSRAWNVYNHLLNRLTLHLSNVATEAVFREKYGRNFSSLADVASNTAYFFTNSEPLLDFAPPTLSRIVYIPGIGAKPPGKLDKDWEAIMTKRDRVVLISFGSNARSADLPEKAKEAFLTMISRFPHITFIWKYEMLDAHFVKTNASTLSNIEFTKWMPQNDILAHKNLAMFITHGGMGSTQELSRSGVPGVFIPLYGDQPRNAFMMEYNGIGKVLNKQRLGDADHIASIVKEVLENDSYRQKAQHIARMLAKKPFASEELVVKYVEFAAEFGPPTALRPLSHDMNWIELNNIDVALIAFLALLLPVYFVFCVFKFAVRRVLSKLKQKKE